METAQAKYNATGQLIKDFRAWEAASREADKYNFMPGMFLAVTPIEMPGGCAGTLEASLKATVEPSRIIATGVRISHPTVEIWSKVLSFKSSFSNFTSFTINITETVLKSFVND